MFSRVLANCEFLVTIQAGEWFITSVGSFISIQIPSLCTVVITLGAAEGFITSMNSFMLCLFKSLDVANL